MKKQEKKNQGLFGKKSLLFNENGRHLMKIGCVWKNWGLAGEIGQLEDNRTLEQKLEWKRRIQFKKLASFEEKRDSWYQKEIRWRKRGADGRKLVNRKRKVNLINDDHYTAGTKILIIFQPVERIMRYNGDIKPDGRTNISDNDNMHWIVMMVEIYC